MAFVDVLSGFGVLLAISLLSGLVLGAAVYGLLREVIHRMRARRPFLLGTPLDLLVGMGTWLLKHAAPLALGSVGLTVVALVLAGLTGTSAWLLLAAPFMMLLVVFGLASAEYFAFEQAHLSSAEVKEWNRLYKWG